MSATLVAVAVTVAVALGPTRRPVPRRTRPDRVTAARFHTWRPDRRIGTVAAILAATLVIGPAIGLALVALVAVLPRVRRLQARRAAEQAVARALPDAVEMLVLVVHAGLTPHQAIAVLTERAPIAVRPAFGEVRHRVERGSTLADALAALPEVLGARATVVADTLAMAERHGTPIREAVEQLAADARERRRRHAEADARTLPIRMSFPLVTCTLPAFVLLAIVPAVLAALSSLGDTGF